MSENGQDETSNAGGNCKVDVLVLGAGVAGASLAHVLARDGRKVMLVERDLSEPDTFRGELLQPGGLERLNELGLGECVNGIDAKVCEGYVVYNRDGASVPIDYPTWTSAGDLRLGRTVGQPAAGRSFHHGRFVMRLREAARTLTGNVTMVEGTVLDLIEEGGVVLGAVYKTIDKDSRIATVRRVLAPLTVDCTGCFSRLRKRLTSATPSYSSHFVALLLRGVKLPHQRFAYVMLARPAPVLCYEIASGEVRVLVNVPDPLPSVSNGDLKRHLLDTVLPQLPEFFKEPFERTVCSNDPSDSVRSVPCQILPTAAVQRLGALCLGDSLNMRHPLTGGGMTVALSDVALLARLLRPIADLSADRKRVFDAVAHLYDERRNTASTINILSEALYDVFCGGSCNPALETVQQACFDYFPSYGSHCLGLLSGLNPSPSWLIRHFFTVAAFAIYRCNSPWQYVHALYAASMVIVPLLLRDLVQPDNCVAK